MFPTPPKSRVLGGNKASPVILYCSGPFCGRSKRLSEELLAAGFTNVRRYQLGIPVWRALGGVTQIELEAVASIYEMDRSAVFIDARNPEEFQAGTLPRAVSVPASGLERGKDVGEVRRAKDDGRLPMEDHNTRVIVFGRGGAQARAVAEAIVGEAFHNVAFYGGTVDSLRSRNQPFGQRRLLLLGHACCADVTRPLSKGSDARRDVPCSRDSRVTRRFHR